MGIFNIFKRKNKFIDDLFGELDYTTFKESQNNFYTGSAFLYLNEVEVTINADTSGPTEEQKDFFTHLQQNYPTLKENIIIPFLKNEFEDWIEENQITNFDKEFIIDGIAISRITNNTVEWEITYDCLKIKHWITIIFSDFAPQHVVVDG